jgi:DNA-binding transcriptional regulator YiaG
MARAKAGPPQVNTEELTIRLPRLMVAFLKKSARDAGESVSDVVHDLVHDAMIHSFERAELVDRETDQPSDSSEAHRDRTVLARLGLAKMGAMSAAELLEARRHLGLTQAALADALKVDVMSVSRWERGVVGIRPRHAFRVRALLQKASGSESSSGPVK